MAVALVLAASFAGALLALGRRIEPSEWAQLGLVSLVGAAVLLQSGMALMAAPAVLRFRGVSTLASAVRQAPVPAFSVADATAGCCPI